MTRRPPSPTPAFLRPVLGYFAVLLALAGGVGWLFHLAFGGADDLKAIGLSGAVVVVVQLAGFAGLRALGRERMMVGWGLAALLRLLTMVVYAVLVAKVLILPLVPALLSMATLFFLSTLIEPLFLRT